MTTCIVNFGMGNVGSIANMIKRLGAEAVISADVNCIESAKKLILPGVGSFDQGMLAIKKMGLLRPLQNAVARGTPILGICLGMQLMMERSEEGSLPGLGFVSGDVKRFPSGEALLKVPHMGWNKITLKKPCPLFHKEEKDLRYYFVHSYYISCTNNDDVVATSFHGREFVSVFQRGSLFGVQFHPEKSHRFGMALFNKFLAL
jgi:imidazole glycerol-phosphate synthase subunit HisH